MRSGCTGDPCLCVYNLQQAKKPFRNYWVLYPMISKVLSKELSKN